MAAIVSCSQQHFTDYGISETIAATLKVNILSETSTYGMC
jgi:hypothetical protein